MGFNYEDYNPVEVTKDVYNKSKSGDLSGAVTSSIKGTTGYGYSWAGDPYKKAMGQDHSKQDDLDAQSAAASAAGLDAKGGVLASMKDSDKAYLDKLKGYNDAYAKETIGNKQQYLDKLKGYAADAEQQGKDAKATYTNDIQPRLKSAMEDAQKEAGSAMTLQQSMDPNNSVHQAVEGKYNDLAGGVQKQGLADYGVLSALGAQATQNTMGAAGSPMTGQQMGMISANNSRNASQAYNIAAQRMNDLKQQGIDRGFNESDKAYDRGTAAKDGKILF